MKQLVIGRGEVGLSLSKVLGGVDVRDVDEQDWMLPQYDVLHIAYPWQIPDFVGTTKAYQEKYRPQHVIVHSTVPVGTCDKNGWTHSPVRGKHPNLEEGLRHFTKHFGGELARLVAHEMEPWFPNWIAHDEAAITEAGKLWELTAYGMEIVLNKYIHEYCRRMNLPFNEVYNDFADSYNAGWEATDNYQYIKPVLEFSDGPIGGHCVVPGAEILNKGYRNLISEVIIEVQKELSSGNS